jgi:hypothetical protein
LIFAHLIRLLECFPIAHNGYHQEKEKSDEDKKTNRGNNTPPFFQTVPYSRLRWLHYATKAGVRKSKFRSIRKLRVRIKYQSGAVPSSPHPHQKGSQHDFVPDKYQLEEKLETTRKPLNQTKGFRAYLNAIREGTGGGTGHFSEARKH